MQIEELKRWLDSHEGWDYRTEDGAIIIRNDSYQTMTRCTFDAVEKNTHETIIAACAQGRNVDHVTRVTGYFSKVSGWNRGKTGELKDRHRSTV